MTYLDHHAATPVCGEALQAMGDALHDSWANPSSIHSHGRKARGWFERARAQVAHAIGAEAADIILTSGGTEACNLGLRGLVGAAPRHMVTTRLEHPAVAAPIAHWQRTGTRVSYLEVTGDADAMPGPDALEAAITDDTQLVAVQWVNHETAIRWPIEDYAAVCLRRGIPFFVDASQALGKLEVDVQTTGVTALAIAAPKIGGPAGAGALWLARGQDIEPVLLGGGQERGRRPGSPDVVNQVGFGAACAALPQRLATMPRLAALRDRVESAMRAHGGLVNGARLPRVSTATNASFSGRRGEALVAALDLEGVCASSGAACSSGLSAPSPVLQALYPEAAWRAGAAVRFSLGPETSDADVDRAAWALQAVLARPAA